jgi:hypothetical protein
MCRFNNCGHTIDGKGLTKDLSLFFGQIPATWLVAHKVMSTLSPKLNLRQTDVSFILTGEVSIHHVMNICKSYGLQILNGTTVNCLARKGIVTLQDFRQWKKNGLGKWVFEVSRRPDNETWTEATQRSWDKVKQMMTEMDMGWSFEGDEDLLSTRPERRRAAENQIKVLTNLLDIHPSLNATDGRSWVSDGSMVPASAGLLDDKTVTAALTGPKTMVMRMQGRNSNILHGEIFGIIMGHLLIPCGNANDVQHLYTDHLNTTQFLPDSHSNVNQEAALCYRNGRSVIRRNLTVGCLHQRPLGWKYTRINAKRRCRSLCNDCTITPSPNTYSTSSDLHYE